MEIDIEHMGWPKHVVNVRSAEAQALSQACVDVFICMSSMQVAVGTSHTLLSTADNAVYGFGSNIHGELGMTRRQALTRPTRVEGLQIGDFLARICLCFSCVIMVFITETGRHHALAAGEHTSFVGTETSLQSAGNIRDLD